MRRLVSVLAVTAGLTLLTAPAHAQDTRDYPPKHGGLMTSESTISPGDRFTVSGGGAEPGTTVTFTLKRTIAALGGGRVVAAGSGLAKLVTTSPPETQHLVSLGSTTNPDGQFSATLTVPAGTEPGVYTLTASSGGGFLAAMTLRVVTVSGIGGLPFTGAKVLPGLAAGVALIVAGGLLLLSLKRRRPAA
jgi:hypothetical protein